MSVVELYEGSIKTLSAAERLRLATMILNDIPPEGMVDYSTEWSDEDIEDFRVASWKHVEKRLADDECD